MPSRLGLAALLVLLLSGCSTPTRHWLPFETQRIEDWHNPAAQILRYDSNNDGQVTRRELEAGLRQDFWQADTNRDGVLDAEEVRAVNLRRIRIDQSTAIPLIDWNHDGVVDFNEFAAGMRSLFDEYDADGDGVVTLKEMHVKLQNVVVKPPASGAQSSSPH
jgi:Ca2+-binding EF-hand superfamily protein